MRSSTLRSMTLRIDVVFDVPATSPYHRQTVEAVRHAGTGANVDVEVNVVTTPEVNDRYLSSLPDGVVIGPGTPYEVPDGAETVVRTARERGLPLVGT